VFIAIVIHGIEERTAGWFQDEVCRPTVTNLQLQHGMQMWELLDFFSFFFQIFWHVITYIFFFKKKTHKKNRQQLPMHHMMLHSSFWHTAISCSIYQKSEFIGYYCAGSFLEKLGAYNWTPRTLLWRFILDVIENDSDSNRMLLRELIKERKYLNHLSQNNTCENCFFFVSLLSVRSLNLMYNLNIKVVKEEEMGILGIKNWKKNISSCNFFSECVFVQLNRSC